MSKEQKFHKLIQKQDVEEKEDLWNKIEQQTEKIEQVELGGGVVAKKQPLSKQNKIIICAVALLMAILGIVLICRFVSPKNDDEGFRYCKIGDYYSVDSDESINDYAIANDLDLLYFKWYEESMYYADSQFKLNATDEIVCLCEKLIDENEIEIEQYITQKKTQIDFLNAYSESCNMQTTIKSIEVNYGTFDNDVYVSFSYKNYNYYFKFESAEQDYVLALLEDLIQ